MSNNLPSTRSNLPSTDFRKGEEPELVTIVFGKSNSYYYKYALKTAYDSDHFENLDDLDVGLLGHQASYKQSRESAVKALALLTIVSGWKSTRVSHNGNLFANKYQLMETLRCYITGTLCNDYRAHCHTPVSMREARDLDYYAKITMDDILHNMESGPEREAYIIPCKRVAGSLNYREIMPDIKMSDRVQAAAIEKCCHFCPLFDETKTRKL